ncbi:MAG: outer membrane protein [Cyanobacterium sp.]
MNKTLLCLISCASLLSISMPGIASEETFVDNDNTLESNLFESPEEFDNVSTSSTALQSFEIDSSNTTIFSNTPEESEIAQNMGGTSTSFNNWYAGASLGVFFPSDGFLDNGFGPSAYLGYQFSPNLGGEIGLLYAGSDLSGRTGDANILSVIASARYSAPFEGSANWNYFGTAGVGFTRSSITAPARTVGNVFQPAIDSRDTSFSFEVKGGVGYEFTTNTSAFAQLRYLNVSGGNSNYFSTELGVHYKF